jgi:sterol desaturase/sphingolipid hydroxylase (fatty acid hydroxylase superfamily)
MKALLIFTLFFVILALSAHYAMALTVPNPLGSGGKDIPTLINTIATWLLGIGSTIAVIMVLWAAFLFMTSGGNQQKVTQARQTLWYAIIGLAVLLLAKGVTSIVQNFLSGRF